MCVCVYVHTSSELCVCVCVCERERDSVYMFTRVKKTLCLCDRMFLFMWIKKTVCVCVHPQACVTHTHTHLYSFYKDHFALIHSLKQNRDCVHRHAFPVFRQLKKGEKLHIIMYILIQLHHAIMLPVIRTYSYAAGASDCTFFSVYCDCTWCFSICCIFCDCTQVFFSPLWMFFSLCRLYCFSVCCIYCDYLMFFNPLWMFSICCDCTQSFSICCIILWLYLMFFKPLWCFFNLL